MNEGVDDGTGVFRFHVGKVLVEDQPLQRLVAADRQEHSGHFHVDSVVADVQFRHAADTVDAGLQDVASAVAQNVIAQIKRHILDKLVTGQSQKKISIWQIYISMIMNIIMKLYYYYDYYYRYDSYWYRCESWFINQGKTEGDKWSTNLRASGVILQWAKIMVRSASAEVKYCLNDGGNSLPFFVENKLRDRSKWRRRAVPPLSNAPKIWKTRNRIKTKANKESKAIKRKRVACNNFLHTTLSYRFKRDICVW